MNDTRPIAWVRVRDDSNGAEYDVHPSRIRPGMTPIPDYPPLYEGAWPRPTKTRVRKDGTPDPAPASMPASIEGVE